MFMLRQIGLIPSQMQSNVAADAIEVEANQFHDHPTERRTQESNFALVFKH